MLGTPYEQDCKNCVYCKTEKVTVREGYYYVHDSIAKAWVPAKIETVHKCVAVHKLCTWSSSNIKQYLEEDPHGRELAEEKKRADEEKKVTGLESAIAKLMANKIPISSDYSDYKKNRDRLAYLKKITHFISGCLYKIKK